MGTIKQGILGGFSGRVGTVVGSTWKSVHYMRALAVSVNNPNTEKQQSQRNKFSTALNFLKTMTPFVRIGYKNYTKDQSAFNAAMSYILKNDNNRRRSQCRHRLQQSIGGTGQPGYSRECHGYSRKRKGIIHLDRQ